MATVHLGPLTPSIAEPVATHNVASGVSMPVVIAAGPAVSATVSSPAALLQLAHQVGEGLKTKSAGLEYHIDMVGGMPRIRIIDKQTMQIIRQIPSDEVLTVHQALERSNGILVKQKI